MTIDEVTEHIHAFRYPNKGDNELVILFEQWNDTEFLHDFFTKNFKDLEFFGVDSVRKAVDDTLDEAEILESIFLDDNIDADCEFKHLDNLVYQELTLSKNKAKAKTRNSHDSWLRIYALRIDKNLYVITGGAIKLTAKMQDRAHTRQELTKLETCRNFLKEADVFDKESFDDYKTEQL